MAFTLRVETCTYIPQGPDERLLGRSSARRAGWEAPLAVARHAQLELAHG
jgi:hypothetical protein